MITEKYQVTIHNSLTNQKEVFKPIQKGYVGVYLCGPTVYGDPHLGHARSAITFDVVTRYFRFLGNKVRYVRNITDVGHLEDEVAEQGEDKVSKKARLEQLEPMEIVQTYTLRYREAMNQLNNLPPSIEPTASGHILEQIKIIQRILDNGWAYEVDGSIYFDLQKYSKSENYGELSGKILEELQTNTRDTEGQDEKQHSHDFALWKKAKPEHIMRWESPWSVGFPGWHLECTAMSTKYLGKTFDIHGGGMDLQFPHHEAEIAQSIGAHGCQPVNYWMHNNMITIDGAKMSKSAGNFITTEEFFAGNHPRLEQAYSPMTVRFFILQAHYRSPIDFSNSALQAAEKGFKKLINTLDILPHLSHQPKKLDEKQDTELRQLTESCYEFMSDDFNTAKTLASLFELSSKFNAFKNKQLDSSKISAETFEFAKKTFEGMLADVLGLQKEAEAENQLTDDLISLLIELRHEARAKKDYGTSDKIRDDLNTIGVQLKDGKQGTEYSY